ncbi:hypothetical protein MKZ38_009149 [Zalerion maritima]|uniref:TFIIS N-terminal domain-containing protein n=1 Tax=Zalerion maritima TaxID=339359 RepID=A0AAD5WT42_9PEZI|nr:hypothetical protein MKZ38_009149 [Zalerion maritima]
MSDADSPAGDPALVPIGDETHLHETTPVDDSDKESIISEIDDQELADYDAEAAQLENRPVDLEDIARSLKATKKKRADGDQPRKPRERRREKKRSREDEVGSDGDGEGKRPRRAGARDAAATATPGADRERTSPEPVPEENLTPEERRQRALSRAMDAALKNPIKRRRKKDEVDLEDALDDQLANLRIKMEQACQADLEARNSGGQAIHKLKLLPEVVSMLSRENAQSAVVDPEGNFLQAVKFFLEPLADASLPAYNIQRDILSCLLKLPLEKETLIQSGLGKIVLHYTKSRQPQPQVKRMAEKLVEEWSRPILKRSHDYRKRHVETRDFDPAVKRSSQFTLTQRPAMTQAQAERARMLAPPALNPNRAQIGGLPATYTIAPKSTLDPNKASQKPIGAGGLEAFRKMTQKKGRRG